MLIQGTALAKCVWICVKDSYHSPSSLGHVDSPVHMPARHCGHDAGSERAGIPAGRVQRHDDPA